MLFSFRIIFHRHTAIRGYRNLEVLKIDVCVCERVCVCARTHTHTRRTESGFAVCLVYLVWGLGLVLSVKIDVA